MAGLPPVGKARFTALGLVLLLCAAGLPVGYGASVVEGGNFISIQNDKDFTPQNGVVGGAGTAADPFRIEGWVLAGPGAGVRIADTRSHVVIRNLTIDREGWGSGIRLDRSSHVTVEGSTVKGDVEIGGEAVRLSFTNGVTLRGNRFAGGNVVVSRTNNTTLAGNTVTGGYFEFSPLSTSGNDPTLSVDGNNTVQGAPMVALLGQGGATVSDQTVGQLLAINCTNLTVLNVRGAQSPTVLSVHATDGATFRWVEAQAESMVGVNLTISDSSLNGTSGISFHGTNITLQNITFGGATGFWAGQVSNLLLDNVSFQNTSYGGIYLYDATNVTIRRSSFVGGEFGALTASAVTDLRVEGCTFRGGDWYGIALGGTTNVTLQNNWVEGTPVGVSVMGSQFVSMTGNRFGDDLEAAVSVDDAWGVNMTGNDLGARGLVIQGSWPEMYSSHRIDETNSVGGGPVLYRTDCNGLTIEGRTVGQVILSNCTGTNLRDLRASGAAIPLQGAFLLSTTIDNVSMMGNSTGARFLGVEVLAIRDSSFGGHSECLDITSAALVEVRGGSFVGCRKGVRLNSAWESSVSGITVGTEAVTGLELGNVEYTTVGGNTFQGGGITMLGQFRDSYATLDIQPNNTVKGLPIEFHRNETGTTIASRTVGQFIAVNCTTMAVVGLETAAGTPGALFAYVQGLNLLNSSFTGSTSDGLWITHSSAVQVRGVRSAENGIENLTEFSFGRGAAFTDSSVVVEDSTFERNSVAGIQLQESSTVRILRSRVLDNRYIGLDGRISYADLFVADSVISSNGRAGQVQTDERSRVTLSNLTVAGNEVEGFRLYGEGEATVQDSNFSDNGGPGLTSSISTLLVEGSTFLRNDVGLEVTHHRSAPNGSVTYNVFEGNGVGARISGASGLHIHYNQFIENGVQAVAGDGPGRWDGGFPQGGNYWSDYNGTDRCTSPTQDICPIPDGLGDTPYDISVFTINPPPYVVRDRYPLVEPKERGPTAPDDERGSTAPAPDIVVFLTTLPGALLFLMVVPAAAAAAFWRRSKGPGPPGDGPG